MVCFRINKIVNVKINQIKVEAVNNFSLINIFNM